MTSISDISDIERQPIQRRYDTTHLQYGTNDNGIIPTPFYPRLIPRNLPFFQSQNRVKIYNRERDNIPVLPSETKFILSYNWFHIMLRWPTLVSVSLLVGLWLVFVVIFAHIYVVIDARKIDAKCGLGAEGEPIPLSAAFAFSLETCTTVGYGLPNNSNNFFDPECRGVQITITLQMITSMLFNAFLTAFLWCRLARCEQRGAQVMFSNKAIIEKRDGKWLFHVRIYDLDSKLPIVEAHVRLYCVSWDDYDNDVKKFKQPQLMQVMRIIKPNDDLGSVVFTSVPFNATHHIDFYSPLVPDYLKKNYNYMQGHGLNLRESDQMAGSNSAVACPICGETYETFENLRRHINFNKKLEEHDYKNLPIKGTHRDPDLLKSNLTKKFELTEKDIKEHLRGKEIILIVEGIEPLVSGTFQALHSYKANDIVFDSCFAPCISQIKGKAVVDLDRFHEVVPNNDRGRSLSVANSDDSTSSTRRKIFPHK